MTDGLKDTDRDVLSFRPNIGYVEPDQEPGTIDPITTDDTRLFDYKKERTRIKKKANAISALATAVQAKADRRAAGMKIKLDPIVDSATVQAMARLFPNLDPTEITYAQYRQCKDRMRDRGLQLATQPLSTVDDVSTSMKKLGGSGGAGTTGTTGGRGASANTAVELGGYGTVESTTGGLRPELDQKAQIIEPLNIPEFQDILIRILVNFIWKNFIKPVIPLPPGISMILPDEIAPLPEGFSVPELLNLGLNILGEDPAKIQKPPVIPDVSELF